MRGVLYIRSVAQIGYGVGCGTEVLVLCSHSNKNGRGYTQGHRDSYGVIRAQTLSPETLKP